MTDRGWAKAVDRVRPLTTLSKPVGLLQNPRAFVQLCATGLPDEEKIDTTTRVHGVELTEEQLHAMAGAYPDGIRENEAIVSFAVVERSAARKAYRLSQNDSLVNRKAERGSELAPVDEAAHDSRKARARAEEIDVLGDDRGVS